MVVDYRGRRCSCGNIGCVEAMASSFFLPDIILPYINKWVEDRAWTPIDRVHIVLSELGDNAALLGLNYYLTSVKRRRNEKVFKL